MLPARGYCSVNNLSTGCDGLARWAEHLILPWITFGVVNAALFTMMIRALVIEELNEEYVRTAKAKGAGQGRIVRAHLLRNVTLPLVTMIGMQAATSLGGVVFIESVFDLPGLGGMLRRGAQQRDLPLTAGSVLFLALAIMVLNLIVDIFYGMPRSTHSRGGANRSRVSRWSKLGSTRTSSSNCGDGVRASSRTHASKCLPQVAQSSF